MPYIAVFDSLTGFINESLHFNPLFSWFVVSFTYFTLGIQGGSIWKYLFWTSTSGCVADLLRVIIFTSKNLNNYALNIVVHLTWIEGIFWTLSEWGYVYINYIKIRTVIHSLRKKFWNVIMGVTLVYSLIIRVFIMKCEYDLRINDYETDVIRNLERKRDRIHGLLYMPLGIICTSFIYFILVEFLSNADDDKTHTILSILLHSTLTRMFIVSLLFIGLSIIVYFDDQGIAGFFRVLFYRTKGNLGIIFLIDTLLLRIDLDSNQISMQTRKLKKLQLEKDLNGVVPFNYYKNDEEEISSREITNFEYARPIFKNKNESEESEETPKNQRKSNYYSNPTDNHNPTFNHNLPIHHQNNIQNYHHDLYQNDNSPLTMNDDIVEIKNTEIGNMIMGYSPSSNYDPYAPPPSKPLKNEKRKSASANNVNKPPMTYSVNNVQRKFSQPNTYLNNIYTPVNMERNFNVSQTPLDMERNFNVSHTPYDRERNFNVQQTPIDLDRRQSVHSILLGDKVYSKVALESSGPMASKPIVSPTPSFNNNSKFSPKSPSLNESEINAINIPSTTALLPTATKINYKKNPGNILIESSLM